jgi:hypothetical protein
MSGDNMMMMTTVSVNIVLWPSWRASKEHFKEKASLSLEILFIFLCSYVTAREPPDKFYEN